MSDLPDDDSIAATRRDFALQVVRRLREAGYEALWAGGCVRDLLLDRAPIDYDVATSARPEHVRELFGHRRTLPVGAAFGVIIVLGPSKSAGQVEVATFRNDAQYSDGRRPDSVTYSTAREDALRRDFTINGMFFDPIANEVIDYVGGRADLERGIIRAIGDADARIGEDKLRMLRAVRFAARFGFTIETLTQAALARHWAELAMVSGERLAGEMQKTLTTSGRETALRRWAETGLLNVLAPLAAENWDRVGELTCGLVRSVIAENWVTPFAALLFPTCQLLSTVPGRSVDNEIRQLTADAKRRLKLSNEEVSQLSFILASQGTLERAKNLKWSELQPFLIHPSMELAVQLLAARIDCGVAEPASFDWLQAKLSLPVGMLNPVPLVNGSDLNALGFCPGPLFKALLESVRKAQLDGELLDRESALRWLQSRLESP